jgi:hypothetical protein
MLWETGRGIAGFAASLIVIACVAFCLTEQLYANS